MATFYGPLSVWIDGVWLYLQGNNEDKNTWPWFQKAEPQKIGDISDTSLLPGYHQPCSAQRQSADKDYSKNTCLLLAFFTFYLIFVVDILGFEKSCVKKFIKVQATGTSSKLSETLNNRLKRYK